MAVEEEFEIARSATPAAPDRSRASRDRSRTARAPWPWAVAAAALVAVGVVAAPEGNAAIGVVDAIEEPHLAWQVTLDTEVPDDEAPFGGPLAPSRRVAVVDGVAVVATDDLLAAYALSTGEPLWRSERGRFCTLHGPIVCVDDPGLESARVVRIDAASGDVLELAVPHAVTATPAPEGVVALVADGSEAAAARLDLGGSERWRTTVIDNPVMVERAVPMAVVGEHAYIQTSPPAVLDLATGEPLPDTITVLARDGAGFRSGFGSAAWELADGTTVDLPANALPLDVDDDPRSSLDAVLTSQGTVLVDATGEPVLDFGDDQTLLVRLDGRLVTTNGYVGDVISHGLSTDEVTRAPGWLSCPCLGSGSTLVALTTQYDALEALDVRTLETLWSVPIGQLDTHDPIVLGEHGVLVLDDDRLAYLPWG